MGLFFVSLPKSDKEENIEEVHPSQNQKNKTDLGSENLKDILIVDDRLEDLQIEDDKSEVDEVEADDEQVIDTVGELFPSFTTIDQKDAAVFVKSAGDPNR